MAVIKLTDLTIVARHGVYDQEKTTPQPFKVNLELQYNSTKAQQSDNIEDALDYGALRDKVIEITENNSFNLLERLAQEIADQLLQDTRIEKLVISIEKPAVFESGRPSVLLTFPQPE